MTVEIEFNRQEEKTLLEMRANGHYGEDFAEIIRRCFDDVAIQFRAMKPPEFPKEDE